MDVWCVFGSGAYLTGNCAVGSRIVPWDDQIRKLAASNKLSARLHTGYCLSFRAANPTLLTIPVVQRPFLSIIFALLETQSSFNVKVHDVDES